MNTDRVFWCCVAIFIIVTNKIVDLIRHRPKKHTEMDVLRMWELDLVGLFVVDVLILEVILEIFHILNKNPNIIDGLWLPFIQW